MANKKILAANEKLKEIKRKRFKESKIQTTAEKGDIVIDVRLDHLQENPYQPRIEIKDNELKELANSIQEQGLIQPIAIVKNPEREGHYYIVSGHRRVAAHKLLGKKRIKAIEIQDNSSSKMASAAIVENFQREDLNVIELAIAINRYKEEFKKTYDEIAKEIGKSKAQIVKLAGILNLPKEIIEDIRMNKSTKDVESLSLINSLGNKMRKVRMRTIDVEKTQKDLYYGLLEHGREWLKGEIKRLLSFEEGNSDRLFTVKKEKKRIVFAINRVKLDEDKIKKIEEAIKKILAE